MTERFNVSGALLVKLFGRPESESGAFARRAGRVRDIGVTSAMYSRVFMTSLGLLASLATALVYGLGGVMAVGGTLGIGTLVALTSYLNRLYGPLTSLSNVQVDVMTTLVSFERVLEVLDLTPTVTDSDDPVSLPDGPVGVELDRVRFRYPDAAEVSLASLEGVARLDDTPGEPVLHDVTLRVEPGRTLALVGPSGAGKSTIAGLVSRLYDPTGGSVRIGGVDLRATMLADVRNTVGVVAQDVHLFHDTLRANLRYAKPGATDDELIGACRPRRYGTWSSGCPMGWTPWWATVATGCRAARSSGSPSPGCCSRIRAWWCSTRPPPTSTPGRRLRCRRRSAWPSPGGPRS
jgi:ATP-binding cassette subfamily B protein